MSTPSEKPTCRHGFDRGHDLGVTIGDGEFAVVDCPGPVIATEPETPVPEATVTLAISDKELAAIRYGYGALKMRKHPDALAAAYTIKKMLRRKPAPSEAMCEVHLEKDGRLRISARVRPDQMYATLSALQSTASDPTPELRERSVWLKRAIKAIQDVRDSNPTAYTTVLLSVEELDAVLSALKGEPK